MWSGTKAGLKVPNLWSTLANFAGWQAMRGALKPADQYTALSEGVKEFYAKEKHQPVKPVAGVIPSLYSKGREQVPAG
jgi:hypothetical protein